MSSDTITALREARKRKILQNAEHRLTKIAGNSKDNFENENNVHVRENGKIHNKEASSSTHISNGGNGLHGFSTKGLGETHSQNHVLHNELNYVYNADIERLVTRGSDFTSEINYALNESLERLMRDGRANDLTTEEAEEKITTQTRQNPSQWGHHVCIICLAVMVRFLFALNLGNLIYNSMILPYILMTVSRLVLTRKQPPPLPGLIRSALILCGISPQRVAYLLEFFVIINQISLEFSLYLFTLTVTHGLIGTLRTS